MADPATILGRVRAKGANIVTALGAPTWGAAFHKGLSLMKDLNEATSLLALRPLHTPVRNYLLSTRKQMSASIARVFEKDPVVIDRLMQQIAAPSSLWRKAFRVERP